MSRPFDTPREIETAFINDLSALLQQYNFTVLSSTPVHVQAQFIITVLESFNQCIRMREEWHGEVPSELGNAVADDNAQ